MYKTTNQQVNQDVITDVICDSCQQSCKKEGDLFEYSTLFASWGYASRKDCSRWSLHFCEDCSDKLIIAMGIKINESET